MSLKLVMIGTGSAFAKRYFNTNSIWQTKDFTLLIDCGITAPMALYNAGIPMDKIDGVLITHLHGDHVGGLEEVAFQFKFKYKRKPLLFIPEKLVHPLWENSLKAGVADDSSSSLDDFFQVKVLKEHEPTTIAEGLVVEIIQTDHIPGRASFSLIINHDIFFSADMKFHPDLLLRLDREGKCRLIFHDCQLHGAGIVHTTLDELMSLPLALQEKIILMHYDDDMEDFIGRTGPMWFIKQHQPYVIDERGIREALDHES